MVKTMFYGNLGLEELTMLKSKRIPLSKGNTYTISMFSDLYLVTKNPIEGEVLSGREMYDMPHRNLVTEGKQKSLVK